MRGFLQEGLEVEGTKQSSVPEELHRVLDVGLRGVEKVL
jgi:hypothetical protein